MAQIASTPTSPPVASRLPNLSQAHPKMSLLGLVAFPPGRIIPSSFGARRRRSAVHPALPSPY